LGTGLADSPAGGIWGDDQGNLYIAGRTAGSLGAPIAGGADAVLIKLSPPAQSTGTGAALSASVDGFSDVAANAMPATTASPRPRFTPAARPSIAVVAGVRTNLNFLLNGRLTSGHLARDDAFESLANEKDDGQLARRQIDELADSKRMLVSALAVEL
jgi:hypothetical protein